MSEGKSGARKLLVYGTKQGHQTSVIHDATMSLPPAKNAHDFIATLTFLLGAPAKA